ncbi:MAG: hypothetical protein KF878_31145, partial [Planctomycetes bacterium]|nr:hypothetical protein [Planctomycetota bacterium]
APLDPLAVTPTGAGGAEVPVAWVRGQLATVAGSRALELWDVEAGSAAPGARHFLPAPTVRVVADPAADALFCGGPGRIDGIDLAHGQVGAVWRGNHGVMAVAPSPDGEQVAVGLEKPGGALLLATGGGAPRTLVGGVHGHAFAWSADGERLYAALGEAGLRGWRLPGVEPLALDQASVPATCLALAPDGRVLAVGDITGRVLLLDAETGAEVGQLIGPRGEGTSSPWVTAMAHAALVRNVAFSPGGEVLFSSSLDVLRTDLPSELRVWSVRDRSLVRTVENGTRLGVLALSPDGRWLAAGAGGRALVWDARALAAPAEPSPAERPGEAR